MKLGLCLSGRTGDGANDFPGGGRKRTTIQVGRDRFNGSPGRDNREPLQD